MQIRLCAVKNQASLYALSPCYVEGKMRKEVRHDVTLNGPGWDVNLYSLSPEQAEPFKLGQHFWLSLSPDGEPVL